MPRIIPFLLLLSLAGAGAAQEDPARAVSGRVEETVAVEQGTQAANDAWAAERADLQARFRSAEANTAYLAAQRDLQQAKVDALDERIAEYRRRLTEADLLKSGIQDTLDVVMARLADWVDRDLPFLAEERTRRIANLEAELARPDVTSADKLRRVLEALQIETAYGATVEVTQEEITIDGAPLFVDVLRLGRLSVFWMTPDGRRVGEWDRAAAAWRELPGKHRRPVAKAMEMASRMRPTELIALPLGRIRR